MRPLSTSSQIRLGLRRRIPERLLVLAEPQTVQPGCDVHARLACCSAKTEELRSAYIQAGDEAPSRAALEALHRHLWEVLPDIQVGQYIQPSAWRSNVTGVLRANLIVFWNIDKD
jgi:hypothetical protein